jgi:malonyl-CoA O-methyltransferase
MHFCKNITWSPKEYEEAAVIAREAGEEMLSRLDWMTLQPNLIVEVGSGLGETSQQLQIRYKHASVIAIDQSESMLMHAKYNTKVCADAASLPFANQSVDLLFANFLLPWHVDVASLLREWRRVLKPDGLLMLSALGPDTLQECRPHLQDYILPDCVDMHVIGDLMLQEGFSEPVLDVNHYTTVYKSQEKMFYELEVSGMVLSCQRKLAASEAYQVTYEVIYAHAFAPALRDEVAPSSDGLVRVPLSYLRQQLRSK